jgi:hypothetical protein
MKQIILSRLEELSKELEEISEEKKSLSKRYNDIDIRTHQLVGAIYELQQILITQESQPSDVPQSDQK